MSDLRMGVAETKFAELIWANEPISSGSLAKLALEEMNWKKTTAFTVLKRLCDRGLFQNREGTVTSLMTREEYYARHSEQYVRENFGGSLPAFPAAFGTGKHLSDGEIEQLQRLIESMRG